MLKLVKPHPKYKDSYLKALRDWQSEGLAWFADKNIEDWSKNFDRHVREILDQEQSSTAVPQTTFWAELNGEIAGSISVRHYLNDKLRRFGGNIGYDTVPSYRGRGVATEMLKQSLEFARKVNLKEVLLTCDYTNSASIKVIEKNGGVLAETKFFEEGKPLKRYYWIKL